MEPVGSTAYRDGTLVPVQAEPNAGWAFINWIGDCTGVGSCLLTMDSDKSVTAIFEYLPTPQPPPPPLSGKIVFFEWENFDDVGAPPKHSEIYIMNADGTGKTQLTSGPDWERDPVLSPDGSKIAFRANTGNSSSPGMSDGRYDLYVMNSDGSGLVRLDFIDPLEQSYSAKSLDWSPDGSQILFESWSKGITSVNVDGSGLNQIKTSGSEPRWSPDGTKIAYATGGTPGQIAVVNADGTGAVQVTDNVVGASGLDWSPDSSKLVIVTAIQDTPEGHNVAVMNSDGTNRTNLGLGKEPSWSPDGTKIVYTSNDSLGKIQIYVMDSDGANPTQLTFNDGVHLNPHWSP
jgi:TolB protein